MRIMSVVSQLLHRQSRHPLVEGFPTAARIGNLPLFLGEARAVQDVAFLERNEIQAIVALGTSNLAGKPLDILVIDILDMEDELLLPHLDECLQFLNRYLAREKAVLVHCVYGQSRSAALCVAYLMATRNQTLLEAFNMVQQARPCISINAGFLRQLDMFERMDKNPDIMGCTTAHAELRTMMAHRERVKTGGAGIVALPQLIRPCHTIRCRKCSLVLCTTRNQLTHMSPAEVASEARCAAIYIEPMSWMTRDPGFIAQNDGKLLCPSCNAKLGSWSWIGVKYGVGAVLIVYSILELKKCIFVA
ncbi:hypothetical protein PsorP6_005707 [Peronosclerospora sorghi]|uniref:Uncharacterized protein n=1 Tax=Peronosclerospora sorghi TaxID=230839 RepID=A0ACC0W4M8_9STRA|nr:hypothetical protein PsorP6_005707 [Peronosclerospora sorghi]